MALEVEIKLKVDELDNVRHRLKNAGAVALGAKIEHDTFYDPPDGSFFKSDKAFRFRTVLRETGSIVGCYLTFKGPRQAVRQRGLKIRQEVELHLHRQFQAATRMLQCLGYRKVLEYQKRRESWRLNRCKVELDQLPKLGFFVEIEGPGRQAVTDTLEQLQMTTATSVPQTYVELVSEYLQTSGADRLVFEDKQSAGNDTSG